MPGRCWCGGRGRSAAGFRDDWDLPRGIIGPGGLVSCGWGTRGQDSAQDGPPSGITAVRASLLRGQVLEDQGVLGRDEIAERHLVKRKLPEEREHPVVVNLRSARQADLFDVPAARLSQSVADLPNKSLLRLELKARRNGKCAY